MAYTLVRGATTVNLGDVQSESSSKESNLFEQAMPASDSTATIVLDIFGVVRKINVSGIKSDTLANLRTFVTDIESLINGNQTATARYHSDFRPDLGGGDGQGNIDGYITNFRYDFVAGDPNKISYSFSFTEGA